jgi:hypothetical protein
MVLTNLAVIARCPRKTVLGALSVRKQCDFWQLALSYVIVVIMFFSDHRLQIVPSLCKGITENYADFLTVPG